MKQPVLDYLRKYHGITTHTIYNDIFGYIQNQEKHQPAYVEFFIGLTSSMKGEYEKAIEHYDQAIRLSPQIAQSYNNRGIAKSKLEKYEEAIADFNKAISINPQDDRAYNNRGIAKGKLKKYEEAIADFNEAIRLNPKFAEAYHGRGNIYKEIEEYEKARADLQHALELATEQDNQALAQDVQKLLDELLPAGGED